MPENLKPLGVKAPLHLIPWGAVPTVHVPEALGVAASLAGVWPDGDPYNDPPSEYRTPTLAEALAATLIERAGIYDVAQVMAYGARKYARDNWRSRTWNDATRDEYVAALCRHLRADMAGERTDPESGELHLAHAAACALIWRWHELNGTESPEVER